MNRLKKIYCSASFIFACVVLISTILCMAAPAKAFGASMDPDSITDLTPKDTQAADHNDKRMVSLLDNNVHTRESYHLVQLSTPLVNVAPFWGENPYLKAFLHYFSRHDFAHVGNPALREASYSLVYK